MTEKEFNLKYKGVDTDALNYEELRQFKNDCFDMYEEYGFLDKYQSPYDELEDKIGMGFKVLRRATEEEVFLEQMPIWFIEFDNGDTAFCYPEEITKLEYNYLG